MIVTDSTAQGLLSRAAQLVRRQQRIHRSGAEALQVESDELEAQRP